MTAKLKQNSHRILKASRKTKGETQKTLGLKVGVSDSYIRQLELSIPDVPLFKICNELNLNILSIIDFNFKNELSKNLLDAIILIEKNEAT
jgi:transcriptional regulator with XRE-family HTH domain